MRNLGIFLSLLIAVGSVFAAYHYGKDSSRAKGELDNERYLRMTAEEDLSKAQNKVSSMESELARVSKKSVSLEKTLEQIKAVNEDYRTRLDAAHTQIGNLQAEIINVNASASKSIVQPAVSGGSQ